MEKLKKIISFLLLVFVFLLPFQTRLIYKTGEINGGFWEYGTFSLYASEILLGIIIILSLVYLIIRSVIDYKAGKFKFNAKALGYFGLCALCFIIPTIFAIDKALALYKLIAIIEAFALFFIILLIKPDTKKMSLSIIASSAIQGCVAISQFAGQKILANKWLGVAAQDPSVLGVPVVEVDGVRWLRAFGTFPHPNILAGFLVIALILIIGIYAHEKNSGRKLLLTAIFIIDFGALLVTFSRAGWIVFALCAVVLERISRHIELSPRNLELSSNSKCEIHPRNLGLSSNSQSELRSRTVLKFILTAVVIAILFTISYPSLMKSRILGQERLEVKSTTERMAGYQDALQIIKQNWLVGVGPGNYTLALFKKESTQPAWYYQPVHNIDLLFVSELGIFAIIFDILILYIIFQAFKKKFFSISESLNSLNLLISLVALALLGLFDHYLYSFYFGLMFISAILGLTAQNLITKKDEVN